MTTLTVRKYIAGTSTPLQGARFHVTDSHGMNMGPSNGLFITDENGEFVLTDLIPGTSIVAKEIDAPDGYILDSTPQTIRIHSGESAQYLTFYNAPKSSISVRKLDSVTGQPISGVEFKVTSASGEPLDNDGGRTSTNGIYRTDDNKGFPRRLHPDGNGCPGGLHSGPDSALCDGPRGRCADADHPQ